MIALVTLVPRSNSLVSLLTNPKSRDRARSSGGSSPRADTRRIGKPGKGSPIVFMAGQMRELLLYRAEFLRRSGFSVLPAETKVEAMATIKRGGFDAAILSYTLSSDTVEELGEMIRQHLPTCPVISISRTGSVDRRLSPDETVVGDEGPEALMAALERALRKRLQ